MTAKVLPRATRGLQLANALVNGARSEGGRGTSAQLAAYTPTHRPSHSWSASSRLCIGIRQRRIFLASDVAASCGVKKWWYNESIIADYNN